VTIHPPVYDPPFNVTRASHAVLAVRDLAASKAFYVDLIGLVVSDEDEDTVYLRGLAEVCHHSLVLKRATGTSVCERVGLRVFTEDDLERAKSYFVEAGLPAAWVDVPYQGRTLHVSDPVGTPLELCATMTTKPRLLTQFDAHHGACPHRLDHFQMFTPDVAAASDFYIRLGFRLSEYICPDGTDEPAMVFLQRKGNPHDVVFARGAGPRLHHFALVIPESYHFFFVCDLAENLGFATNVEFGPGRHGPGNALFVYMRDPDGHRVELFNTHYQMMDIEDEPLRWDASRAGKRRWQLPARRSWFTEASPFLDVESSESDPNEVLPVLETYLLATH